MKFLFLIAALLLQAPRGSVTGMVVVSGNSAPIADANVAIVTPDGVLETTTDDRGRFALANVPAGRQTVLIRADGFFVESTNPNMPFIPRADVPVTVSAGAPVAIPTVSMVESGTIIGRVVDPQGNPLPFVQVQALRSAATTLNSGAPSNSASRVTDDRGEYRMFFVPPGEYVIRAQVQPGRPVGALPPRPGEVQTLLSTLFPSTTDMAEADKVIVKSGEEVRGVDITVRSETVIIQPPAPKPTGGFKISGLVIDGAQPWVGPAVLMLGSEAEAEPPRQVGNIIVGGTPGAFEVPSVLPGNYDLFASMGNPLGSPGPGGGVQAWGRAKVQVLDHDVENVRITIRPSVDVSGIVKIDGKLASEGGTLKIGLSPTGAASSLANYRGILDRTQSPDSNGKVTIPLAAVGNYQVFIQGADNLSITDVRQGNTSILASGIDVGNAPPASFELLLSSDGGAVEGVVLNTDKSPMGGATVLLIPADKQLSSLYKTATAGADGKYAFRGVRPGQYKVFAGPSSALASGRLTPELLSRIEAKGANVTVKPTTSARIDVEAITN
jgi:Carboxypeptidase regulatory-like domain